MKKDELIELLQRQIDFLQGKLEEALTSVRSLTATVDEQRKQIASLEKNLKTRVLSSVRKRRHGRLCAVCRNLRRKDKPNR